MKENEFELKGVAVRLVKDRPLVSCEPITSQEKAVEAMGRDMEDLDREEVRVIYLDTKCQPLAWHQVSMGTLDRSIACPREMLKAALLLNAFGIILMHNHPSGDVSPSPEDTLLTSRLQKACELLGMQLFDHIIVGAYGGGYYSYKEHDRINRLSVSELGLSVVPEEIELPGLGLSLVAE